MSLLSCRFEPCYFEIMAMVNDQNVGGGGGCSPKTQDYSNLGLVFRIFFFVFFFVFFFGFSILADSGWINGFWLSGSCWL